MKKTHQLIIIGSGPAGLTAAVYAARADLSPLVLEGKKPGGQLMGTSMVENWPGEKSIAGPQLMQNMKEHAAHFGTQFLDETVVKVDFTRHPFRIETNTGTALQAQAVIIATGASPNKLNIPGEEQYWGKGVSTCAVCDAFFYKDKEVAVVGGGDSAMESALSLSKFAKAITIIQILDSLTASVAMQKQVLKLPNVTVIYATTVTRIEGNENTVTAITITDQKTKKSSTLAVDGVFIAIGLTPNTDIFKGQLALQPSGYIQAEQETITSVAGVFVAGDAHDFRYRQAVTAAGSGCKAALDAERYLNNQAQKGSKQFEKK
jgi:thioredoxin reductase (NADPH)